MDRAMFGRFRRFSDGFGRTALLGVLLGVLTWPSFAHGQVDKYRLMQERQRELDSQFRLFSAPTVVLQVNQFQCGLRNQGDTCSNVFNSPTGGGGFWPTGSPNQYMFNAGLNLAGFIPADAGFAWAGDTTGAYFFDARGTQQHGRAITEIFNSLSPEDLESWPSSASLAGFPPFPGASAFVTDADLFDPVLLGRRSASQQDSWVMYWDGDPASIANRDHPMGITVEQRTLAWNFPTGNEATIFFIYKFTNVTNHPAFQIPNENQFFGGDRNALPDGGWRIDSIYVSFDADPDVTNDFDKNYSTAILPFDMGVAYEGEFVAPDFTFFPNLFFPPFFTNAPGLVGVKYLKSPVDALGEEVGLTLFTVHENPSSPGAQFFDPFGVLQLWRYLSGNIRPSLGDPSCTFPSAEVKERRLCFLAQEPKDTRFLQASGPFSLEPGQSQTVVAAMFAAATVETDQIVPGNVANNPPGIPTQRPGCPDGDPIRPIEVGAGWVSTPAEACPPTGPADQFQIEVIPGSLLGKGLVAQAVFDNKFLLPFAPEPPPFFLVPGDDQVTVVWQDSPTEQNGDPFFVAASNPDNALFNPNYREFDVEGFRIFRGSDPSDLRLIAQFDKKGSVFVDNTCETDPTFLPGEECGETGVEVEIRSPFVQFPVGGIVELADGSALVIQADTALAAEIRAGVAQEMTDTEIPFAFVDRGVRNGFQFFYQVRAFDINSLFSGPTSLSSSSETKSTFPQAPAPNQVLATFDASIAGDDAVPLNPNAPIPTIDGQNGTFSGPFPPSDAFATGFAPLVQRLLPAFTLRATIDSVEVVASSNFASGAPSPECPVILPDAGLAASPFGACWKMFLSVVNADGSMSQEVVRGYNPWWNAFGEPGEVPITVLSALVPFDSASREAFGIPGGGASATVNATAQEGINNSASAGPQARRFGIFQGGSRWFDGSNESVPDPARFIRVGHLDAADTVWSPISHTPPAAGQPAPSNTISFEKQCFTRAVGFLGRAADVRFTWQGNTFGEARDVTHNVDVTFSPKAGPTWGFLTTDANNNGVLDWQDFNFIDRAHQVIRNVGGGDCDAGDAFGVDNNRWDPSGTLTPVDLVDTPTLMATSTDGLTEAGVAGLTPTGTGFGLYVNGERFIFEFNTKPFPPPDGTVWTLRSYSGGVSVTDESAADPSGYSYNRRASTDDVTSTLRPFLIPGLTFSFESEEATRLVGRPDLGKVIVVPNPYRAVSQFDLGPATKRMRFMNLPARATIRIYTLSGILVDVIEHDDPAGGGQATWDLRNRSEQFVASGVYFFHVSTPEGDERVGRFVVLNFSN